MRIIFWGNGDRGVACIQALHDKGYKVDLVITHPHPAQRDPASREKEREWYRSLFHMAEELGMEVLAPEDPNDKKLERLLAARRPDLFILAGYGKILKSNITTIPAKMCINLHAGKLPEYRGSSPMNWALINGERSFGLSIVKIGKGVDTGDIIKERGFDIGVNDTIRELHSTANEQFPLMLLEVLKEIKKGTYAFKKQDGSRASYYPLRFPDDGLILWDLYTAEKIHNRIRALTEPYPCAFTYFNDREAKLLSSRLYDYRFLGEPGRIYKKTKEGLLVCALDRCLWIREAYFKDNHRPLIESVNIYDRLATVRHGYARIS